MEFNYVEQMVGKTSLKKITYIHQYFKTPEEGGAIRSWYIAREMVKKGFQVEMVTTFNEKTYKNQIIEGIDVHYYPIPYENHFSFFKRVHAFLKFNQTVKKHLQNHTKPDLLYITSTPLTVGRIGLWAKKKLNIPYFFEVRDLWPEAPIQMGVIKSSFLKRYLYNLEKKIYRNASQIIALSPGIKAYISKKVNHEKITMVPNMVDSAFHNSANDRQSILKKYNLNDFPIVGYFGTLGKANHLEYLLEIAEKSQLPVQFLIIGKGSEEQRLKELCDQKSLNKKVLFFPFSNKEVIKELLSICAFTYCSFKKIPVLETNSPNKFFDSLAAEIPVIVNTKGWLKELVEEYKCGLYLDPDKPENFDDLLSTILTNSTSLDVYKSNALQLSKKFDRQKLTDKVISIVETIC